MQFLTRWFIRTCVLAASLGVVVLISWAIAFSTLGDVLGAPPPNMGDQATTLLWKGATQLPGHPRAWCFTFGPTRIPGAPDVRIYISPLGRLLRTEPADLAARLKVIHAQGFN